MAYLLIACQATLIGVFATSTIAKVRSPQAYADFSRSVQALRMVPPFWSRMAAGAAVAGEAGVVLLLALPATVPAGFALAVGLLCAFTISIVLALRGGRTSSCRCFGVSAAPLSGIHVVRNVLLLAVALTGLIGVAVVDGPTRDPAGVALAIAAAAVAALFFVGLDDVVALLRPTDRPHANARR